MIIGINASFLRKIDSGIGQVTFNFLRQLVLNERKKSEKEKNRIILYLEEDFDLKKIGLNSEKEKSFWQKKVFLPFYKRDDLIRKIWWEKWLLPRKAQEDGCQIFFSLYQSASVFNKKEIKHLMLVHDVIWRVFPEYINNFRKKIYYYFIEKAITKADKILTVSQSSKKDLQKFFDLENKKIIVVPIDCDQIFKQKKELLKESEEILKKYGVNKKDFIFYVGGFDLRKNVGFLIEAYGLLWQKWNRLFLEKKVVFPKLILAGKFNKQLIPLVENLPEKIDKVVENYSLPKDKIQMIGFIEQNHLPVFYSSAKLFCFPSLYEGFGLSPLEAFNSGCPTLVNKNSSLNELTNEEEQITFLMKNENKLAKKMKDILLDKNLQKKMIEKGAERTREFSWEKFNSKVEKIFLEF